MNDILRSIIPTIIGFISGLCYPRFEAFMNRRFGKKGKS